MTGDARDGARARGLEARIATLLKVGTYVAVGLLAIGTLVLLAAGRSPLDGASPLDVGSLAESILAAPDGFLWLGLVAVILTPAARVAASLVGYARSGERSMALVSAAILAVIALSIALGIGAGG